MRNNHSKKDGFPGASDQHFRVYIKAALGNCSPVFNLYILL